MNRSYRLSKVFLRWYIAVLFVCLAVSLIRFGLYYTYDFDELYHSQVAYLLHEHLVPYKSFFTTYTVLFHVLLVPVGAVIGYSWDTLLGFRVIMSMLFFVRIGAAFFLVKKLFGNHAALFFVWLALVEPFSLFTSHQIRPDNLQMTLYSLGLVSAYFASTQKRFLALFTTGILFGMSVTTHIKIAPSVAVLMLMVTVPFVKRNDWKRVSVLLVSFCSVPVLYVASFIPAGAFFALVQQVIVDPYSMQKALVSRVAMTFFFKPNNSFLFGYLDKPPQWYFAQIFPFMSLLAVGVLVFAVMRKKITSPLVRSFVIAILVATLLQIIFLYSVPTVYIQYFIPVYFNVMLLVAGSFGIWFSTKSISTAVAVSIQGIAVLLLSILSMYTIGSHWIRTGYVIDESLRDYTIKFGRFQTQLRDVYEQTWKIIPASAPVFPALLFRPLVYPLGQFFYPEIPTEIVSRYESIIAYIDRYKVPYMVMSDYQLQRMPVEFQKYLEQNYYRQVATLEVYKRL